MSLLVYSYVSHFAVIKKLRHLHNSQVVTVSCNNIKWKICNRIANKKEHIQGLAMAQSNAEYLSNDLQTCRRWVICNSVQNIILVDLSKSGLLSKIKWLPTVPVKFLTFIEIKHICVLSHSLHIVWINPDYVNLWVITWSVKVQSNHILLQLTAQKNETKTHNAMNHCFGR